MRSVAIMVVVTIAGSALVAQDSKSEAECRAHLQRLGAAVRAYQMIHDGKKATKLSDLYYDGLVDRLSDFTCPDSGTTIVAPTDIDARTDYTLDPAPDGTGALVRERTARHQENQPLAVFADGTVKPTAAATPADAPPVRPPAPPPTPTPPPAVVTPPAVVAPTAAAVRPPSTPSPRPIAPYVHSRRGFGLTPPAGWTIDDAGGRVDLQMKSERGDEVFEVSMVASPPIAPAAFAAQWESANVGPGKTYKVRVRQDQLTVDGRPAHAAVYFGETTIGKAVFVSTDDGVFVVTAVFKSSTFTAGESEFDRMVRSIVLPGHHARVPLVLSDH